MVVNISTTMEVDGFAVSSEKFLRIQLLGTNKLQYHILFVNTSFGVSCPQLVPSLIMTSESSAVRLNQTTKNSKT